MSILLRVGGLLRSFVSRRWSLCVRRVIIFILLFWFRFLVCLFRWSIWIVVRVVLLICIFFLRVLSLRFIFFIGLDIMIFFINRVGFGLLLFCCFFLLGVRYV